MQKSRTRKTDSTAYSAVECVVAFAHAQKDERASPTEIRARSDREDRANDPQAARILRDARQRSRRSLRRDDEAVERTGQAQRRRFPADFMFQMTQPETENLRSQIATSSLKAHGGRRSLPFVFTEHGAIMAATILNSSRAIYMSLRVVRAFVGLRQLLGSSAALARKLAALERRYDGQFAVVFEAIRELMTPSPQPRRRIGFHASMR